MRCLSASPRRVVGHSRPIPTPTVLQSAPHLTTRVNVIARSSPKPAGTDSPPEASKVDVGELAKAALADTVKGEKMTAKEVLGEGTLNQLRRALGEERAGSLEGALDSLLANRRLATLLFAVLDVALIVVAVKLFRNAVSPGQE